MDWLNIYCLYPLKKINIQMKNTANKCKICWNTSIWRRDQWTVPPSERIWCSHVYNKPHKILLYGWAYIIKHSQDVNLDNYANIEISHKNTIGIRAPRARILRESYNACLMYDSDIQECHSLGTRKFVIFTLIVTFTLARRFASYSPEM